MADSNSHRYQAISMLAMQDYIIRTISKQFYFGTLQWWVETPNEHNYLLTFITFTVHEYTRVPVAVPITEN